MDKIFFFDIDGTLAMRGKIPEGNLEMLDDLKNKGYKTFICTGRAVYYARNLFGDHVTGYIGCNGRYIEENNQLLYGKSFTKEEVENYKKRFADDHLGYFFAGATKAFYGGEINEEIYKSLIRQYSEERLCPIEQCESDVYTFDLYFSPERFEELKEVFKGELVLNNHHNGSCDCTTVSFDKGSAIRYLLDYYHIPLENSYAFGDGSNDVYMFREAGNKIAMGNALPELKAKATYITDDYDKQGIQKALAYYKI